MLRGCHLFVKGMLRNVASKWMRHFLFASPHGRALTLPTIIVSIAGRPFQRRQATSVFHCRFQNLPPYGDVSFTVSRSVRYVADHVLWRRLLMKIRNLGAPEVA